MESFYEQGRGAAAAAAAIPTANTKSFMPSLGIRRQLAETEQSRAFFAELKKIFSPGFGYRIKPNSSAITIVEQRLLIDGFRGSGQTNPPTAEEIERLMKNIQNGLLEHLEEKSIPDRLPLYLGSVSIFSFYGNPKIAIIPQENYPEGEHSLIPVVNAESRIAINAITDQFPQYSNGILLSQVNPFNRTSHLKVAEKRKGEVPPEDKERINSAIFEIMQDVELEVCDPEIYFKLYPTSEIQSLPPVRQPHQELALAVA